MNKMVLIFASCIVVITTTVFFLYSYLRKATPVNFEGVYLRYAEHEFGKEWDTLSLRKEGAPGGRYLVSRRWKYERLLDGKVLPPEYKHEKTAIQLLDAEGLFVEEESGIRYSFHPDKNELLAGTIVYKKIK